MTGERLLLLAIAVAVFIGAIGWGILIAGGGIHRDKPDVKLDPGPAPPDLID